MADNTRLNPGFGGDNIALDDISDSGVADGAKVQRIKPGFGTDGNFTDVSSSNPLPVDAVQSSVTSSTPLEVSDPGGLNAQILDQLKVMNFYLASMSGVGTINPFEIP